MLNIYAIRLLMIKQTKQISGKTSKWSIALLAHRRVNKILCFWKPVESKQNNRIYWASYHTVNTIRKTAYHNLPRYRKTLCILGTIECWQKETSVQVCKFHLIAYSWFCSIIVANGIIVTNI